jgi:hypothetical protein
MAASSFLAGDINLSIVHPFQRFSTFNNSSVDAQLRDSIISVCALHRNNAASAFSNRDCTAFAAPFSSAPVDQH